MTLQLRSIIHALLRGIVSALGLFRRIAILLVVLGMLALNVASFAFEQVGAIFSTLSDSIFRTSWVADVSENATAIKSRAKTIEVENNQLRNANLELENRNRRLASSLDEATTTMRRQANQVTGARNRNMRLSSSLDEAKNTLQSQADEIAGARKLRSQFDEVGGGISRRIARGGARNIAAIPFESAPFVGALTVTVITGAEVYDACQTFEEMQKLRELAGFERLENLMEKTCDYVPFVGGTVNIKDMSIPECYDHARSLAEIDVIASEALAIKCECVQANPSREAICFPESTSIDADVGPINGKPDRL